MDKWISLKYEHTCGLSTSVVNEHTCISICAEYACEKCQKYVAFNETKFQSHHFQEFVLKNELKIIHFVLLIMLLHVNIDLW